MGDKAAAFERVSTGGQDEANQRPDIDRHCDTRGYEITRRYSLRGKSAYKGAQRGEIAKVIEDIRNGDVTVVVCWCLDRWTREGIAPYFALKTEVEAAGGRIEFALEPSMSELEEAVKSWMAEQESKRKSERITAGLATARANMAATQHAPWGYRVAGPKRNKRFEPTADGRRWVPAIFGRIVDGESLAATARWLTEQKAGGKRWTTGGVRSLVHHTAYSGKVYDADGKVVHQFEALVDMATFERAQKALKAKERKSRGRGPKAMLSGALECGKCLGPVYRTSPDKGRITRYYRCAKNGCVCLPEWKVNRAVDEIAAAAFNAKIVERKLVPGVTYDAEIAAAEDALRRLGQQGLSDEEEDAERARLRAERNHYRSLPTTPDSYELVETDRRYSDAWAALAESERGPWLKSHGFTVYAHKDAVTLSRSDLFGPYLGDVDMLTPEPRGHSGRRGFTVPLP